MYCGHKKATGPPRESHASLLYQAHSYFSVVLWRSLETWTLISRYSPIGYRYRMAWNHRAAATKVVYLWFPSSYCLARPSSFRMHSAAMVIRVCRGFYGSRRCRSDRSSIGSYKRGRELLRFVFEFRFQSGVFRYRFRTKMQPAAMFLPRLFSIPVKSLNQYLCGCIQSVETTIVRAANNGQIRRICMYASVFSSVWCFASVCFTLHRWFVRRP